MPDKGNSIATAYVQLSASADGIQNSISEAIGEGGKSGGKSIKNSLSNVAGNIAKISGKAIAASATAIAGGVAALSKQAVSAYADYEQLAGGIVTLFGEGNENAEAVKSMMQNASDAYKTAGLSMNDYMETAIQSSAAMISSLEGDTKKAAEMVDLSIVDMSDNVNKMGTSMEAVQNAYRGFSRGNFTMLDNLALGFSGTKEGMQELLDKATEISKVKYNIGSYADIVSAIHVVQDSMGITGTTVDEGAKTISGSLGMVKAAWQNLITGIADDNADMSGLIDNLLTSILGEGEGEGLLNNLLPRIEAAVDGVGKFLEQAVPRVIEKLPDIVSDVLPGMLKAVTGTFNALISSAPDLLTMAINVANTVAKEIPGLVSTLLPAIADLIETIGKALPGILDTIIGVVVEVVPKILEHLPEILSAVLTLIETLVQYVLSDGLPKIIEALPAIIEGIVGFIAEGIPMIIKAILSISDTIVKELPNIIATLIGALPDIISGIVTGLLGCLPDLVAGILQLTIMSLVAVPLIIVEIVKRIPEIVTGIVNGFKENWPKIKQAFVDMFTKGSDGIASSETLTTLGVKVGTFFNTVISSVGGWFTDVKNKFLEGIGNAVNSFMEWREGVIKAVAEFFQPAVDKILAIWNWFSNTFGPLLDAFRNLFSTILEAIRVVSERIWTSISNKVMEIWNGIVSFFTPVIEGIKNTVQTAFTFIHDKIANVLNAVWTKVSQVWTNIQNKFTVVITAVQSFVAEKFEAIRAKIEEPLQRAKDKVSEIFNGIRDTIKGVVDQAVSWGRDLIGNIISGITEKMSGLTDTINGIASSIHDRLHFSEPDVGPLSDFHTYAPDMMKLFAEGIRDNTGLVTGQIDRSFDLSDRFAMPLTAQPAGAGASMEGMTFVLPVYIGTDKIDEQIVRAIQAHTYRSGGR